MSLKITTSVETTVQPWPNKWQHHSITMAWWNPRCLLLTKIVISKRQKTVNWFSVNISFGQALMSIDAVTSLAHHGISHSWAKSKLFVPADLGAVHTESSLNFIVIRGPCFRVCRRTRIACCLAEQTLPLISAFMLDRSRDCLLTRRVTMQRDSPKTRLTDSYFQFVATPAESDRVTTDTQFLSCSLAGRKCWKWWNRCCVSSKIWRHTKHP